jgi:hypothetical protein
MMMPGDSSYFVLADARSPLLHPAGAAGLSVGSYPQYPQYPQGIVDNFILWYNNTTGGCRRDQRRKRGGEVGRLPDPPDYYTGRRFNMELQDLLTVIGNYAFPVVMCLLLFKKLDNDQQKTQEALDKRDQLHREEIQSLRSALDNNTAAINALAVEISKSE